MELNSIFFHLNRTLRILLEYRPKMVLSREALTSLKPLQLNKQVKIDMGFVQNLKVLECPGICKEVLESPGIRLALAYGYFSSEII